MAIFDAGLSWEILKWDRKVSFSGYSNAFATKNSMLLDIHNLTEEQRDAYIQTKGGGRKLLNARAILLCSIHHSIFHRFTYTFIDSILILV